ncbi:hypothetical protein SALBM311S_00130 [Streptomyces alboniger]
MRRATYGGRPGSVTVWMPAGRRAVLEGLGMWWATGQAVVARHGAAGGADLAALAVADHWVDGGTAACARADRVARAQSARLVRCVLVGEISDVTAASGRGPFAAEVGARAGCGRRRSRTLCRCRTRRRPLRSLCLIRAGV